VDPRLLEYYTSELLYMRELAGEFAQAHPKIARRLGMQAGEIGDPYVERLIESFCFMSARMQLRLDAEFPRLTERLPDCFRAVTRAILPKVCTSHAVRRSSVVCSMARIRPASSAAART
jgi:hypothetical protein